MFTMSSYSVMRKHALSSKKSRCTLKTYKLHNRYIYRNNESQINYICLTAKKKKKNHTVQQRE